MTTLYAVEYSNNIKIHDTNFEYFLQFYNMVFFSCAFFIATTDGGSSKK